ncbi:hypothetical protein [Pseudomonas putida]|uniref:hypothetical protein n=1 Tax=Pseudomonas putida TaxID=303 RepID=UPI0011DF6F99|nr:hypothetical protein [Pseudomonas putida]
MFEAKCEVLSNRDFEFQWYLDSIKMLAVNQDRTRFVLEGWVLGSQDVAIDTLSIRDGRGVVNIPLSVSRRDVLRKHSVGGGPNVIVQPYCGFRSEIDISGHEFEIGVVVSGIFQAAACIKFVPPNVVIGSTGWIFLDKDTNGSVAQYRGLKQVGNDWDARWKNYFSAIDLYFNGGCKYIFLLAPSKEEVMREEYPFERGGRTLVDRFLSGYGATIAWPLKELREQKYLSYDAAETHWTDHGANIAFSKALRMLGEEKLSKATSNYEVVSIRGDLGDRLTPPVRSVRLKTLPSLGCELVEDNKIINHGNVKRYTNACAENTSTLLIFGGSSANNFLAHAANIFSQVVFVHTTGAVDKNMVERYKPDLVILQTNQRFIITPPSPFLDIDIYKAKASVS